MPRKKNPLDHTARNFHVENNFGCCRHSGSSTTTVLRSVFWSTILVLLPSCNVGANLNLPQECSRYKRVTCCRNPGRTSGHRFMAHHHMNHPATSNGGSQLPPRALLSVLTDETPNRSSGVRVFFVIVWSLGVPNQMWFEFVAEVSSPDQPITIPHKALQPFSESLELGRIRLPGVRGIHSGLLSRCFSRFSNDGLSSVGPRMKLRGEPIEAKVSPHSQV